MTDHRHALVGDAGRRRHRKAPWLVVAGAFLGVISPVVLFAGAGNPPCPVAVNEPLPVGSGPWIATAYGPPWDAINGSGGVVFSRRARCREIAVLTSHRVAKI